MHAKHPGLNPAIQGIFILSSLETGATLAILESGFLTALGTGLAGAIGADVLARPDAQTITIVGAGVQGILQLEMLFLVCPISRVQVHDIRPEAASEFAIRNGARLGVDIQPVNRLDLRSVGRTSLSPRPGRPDLFCKLV